ncbi:hypothetical protein ACO3TA_00570 [Methanocaldococcus sp. 28A]
MERKVLFLANVGNSDLGKDEKSIFNPREHNIFEESKKLYESGEFYHLEPILLKKKIEMLNNPINDLEIVLFATLQEDENPQDTYYIAKIIKELISKEYPNLKDKIKIEKVSRNPSDYNEMIEYYAKKLNSFDDNYYRVYLGITGGTPAQISSLIINGVLKWEEKTRTLYKPRGKEPKEDKIGEKIFKILKSKEFEALKKSYLYDLAAELMKKYELSENWKCEYHYLKGLHHKKLFNFKRAIDEFNHALKYAGLEDENRILNELNKLEKLLEEPKDLDDRIEKYPLLIDLLIDNAIMKWESGEYVDFVGRIFRIREALLRYIFEKEFRISTEPTKIKEYGKLINKYVEFEKFLDENPKLVEYLKGNGWNERKEINLKVLRWIYEYYLQSNKAFAKKYGFIKGFDDKLEKLSELRNKSIIAHGFEGISKEDIVKLYNKNKNNENEIIEDLNKLKNLISKW